jgi:ATP-binding cassette subfamily F protein 3
MESFVERFRASASKARQAQSRIKALERMQRIAPAHVDSNFEFSFAEPWKLPRPLLALEGQSVGYNGVPLLSGIKFSVSPGDRVALLGRNGAGKSTMMKLLAGELKGMSGTRTEARELGIGYFAQHQLEQLSIKESALENLRNTEKAMGRTRGAEQDLRDFLAGFGFRGDRVFEPIAPLSGGEKARLVLALIAFQRPNLLLLDEPTNHLDLEMRQALAVALQDYTGAVVMVSHDRHLLQTVSNEFFVVHGGKVEAFDGDLDDYAKWLSKSASSAPPDAAKKAASQASAQAAGQAAGQSANRPAAQAAATGQAAPERKKDGSRTRQQPAALRTVLKRCEEQLDVLAKQTTELHAKLADASGYSPAHQQQLEELARQTTQVEEEWLRASVALEEIQHEQGT